MKGNKSRNTKPELLLRKLLWDRGHRGYRVCYNIITGKPDVVFLRKKIAVFVHGCFWHMCPHCNLKIPANNSEFWSEKLQKNQDRDQIVLDTLKAAGWNVVIIWECKLMSDPGNEIMKIENLLSTN